MQDRSHGAPITESDSIPTRGWWRRVFAVPVVVALFAVFGAQLSSTPTYATPCGAGLTVTPVHSPVFYNDLANAAPGMYAGYRISNTTGTDIADLWVTLDNFQGGVVALATNEDGVSHPGVLPNGSSAMAYFYLVANTVTSAAQSHDVNLFSTRPGLGAEMCQQTSTFESVEHSQAANSNKVASVVSGPVPPALGGVVTLEVRGDTGTVGGDQTMALTPASHAAWNATAFELLSVELQLGSDPTVYDSLFRTGIGKKDQPYVVTYRFAAKQTTTAPTEVTPTNHIFSGGKMKHNTTFTDASGAIPTVEPPVNGGTTISKSATPVSLPSTGGVVTYSVTLRNTGPIPVTLDDIVDVLPSSPAATTYVLGSAKFNGSTVSNPAINGATLTFVGRFTVAGASVSAPATSTLTYGVIVPAAVGVYVNSAVGHVGVAQFDTTADLRDHAPAQAAVTVGPPPTTTTVPPTTTTTPTTVPPTTTTTTVPSTTTTVPPTTTTSTTSTVPPTTSTVPPTTTTTSTVPPPTTTTSTVPPTTTTTTVPPTTTTTTVPSTTTTVPPTTTTSTTTTVPPTTTTSTTTTTTTVPSTTTTTSTVPPTTTTSTTTTTTTVPPTTTTSTTTTVPPTTTTTTVPPTTTTTFPVVDLMPSAVGDLYTATEDLVLVVSDPASGLLANDDPGDAPAVVHAHDATSSAGGTVAVNIDGTFTYAPAPDFAGTDSFTYSIRDADGDVSSPGTVTIVVDATPDPVADGYVVEVDTTLTVSDPARGVLGNDDGGTPTARVLAFDTTSANGGTLSMNPDGTFTYVPPSSFSGTDTFTYVLVDGNGDNSAPVTVTVRVNGPPSVQPETAAAVENVPVTIAVLANDHDADGLDESSVIVASAPANGTATVGADGTITYTPAPGFSGTDSFTYRVCDRLGACRSAAVTVAVAATTTSLDVSGGADGGHDPLAVDATAEGRTAATVGTTAGGTASATSDRVARPLATGTLPTTGGGSGDLVSVGLLLVVFGVGLVLSTRRRRTT